MSNDVVEYTEGSVEDFYDSLPNEISIRVKMDKDVFIRVHQLTVKESGSAIMDRDCRAVWGWFLETITNLQRGVRFFYENGTKQGSPSIRFLDTDGKDIDVKTLVRSPY